MAKNMKKTKLNFGCGTNIITKEDGWINVDIQKGKNIDKSFNFEEFPYPLNDDTFDYILIDNVLEHLNKLDKVKNELYRISKNNAIIKIIVPFYNSHAQFSDWTHVNAFNEIAIRNLFVGPAYKGKKDQGFEIVRIDIIPSRFLKWMPKKVLLYLSRILNDVIINIDAEIRVMK